MPCKGGYRESIEEGKRYIREERERMLTDPYRKLWVSLVELVYHSPSAFDGLSHSQKLYFAVRLLEGDVNNGGFHQYFFNDAGSYYAYAEEGLIAVGAFQTLELLLEAKGVLFPSAPVPISIAERRRALPSYLKTIRQRPNGAKDWTTSTSATGQIPRASLFGWKPSHGISEFNQNRGVRREQLSLRSRSGECKSVTLMASCGPTLATFILRP